MSENARLGVEMSMNTSGFSQMLNQAKTHVSKFSQEVGAGMAKSWGGIGKGFIGGIVGAFSFESVKGFIRGIAETAEGIRDTAEQFELSTDAVQQWERALLKANMSASVFYRSLETIRVRRQEAREDPSKRELFEQIGLGNEAVSYNLTDEQFLRAVLRSGASRMQLRELGGTGLARLRAALPDIESEPMLDEETIRSASRVSNELKAARRALKDETVRAGLSNRGQAALMGPDSGMAFGSYDWMVESKKESEAQKKAREDERLRQAKEDAWEADMALSTKELEAELKKEATAKEQLTAAQERLKEARTRNLSTTERRAAMQEELATLDERIAYYKDAEGALGTSDLTKLARLETEREALLGQLNTAREKPTALATDSLTRMGLITHGGMNFSTGRDSVEQAQLDVLRAINSKIAVNNPWAL